MDGGLSSLGVDGAFNAANVLSQDASNFGNDQSYEQMWAMKTFKYAETHFKLISAFDPSKLRLTKYDDQVYRMLKRYFKNLKIDVVEISELKDEEAKARWRPFCEMFKGKVEDFNFGTLLRVDCSKDYSEDNTVLVTRIQFIAIEIARNRRGLNQVHFTKHKDAESEEHKDVMTTENTVQSGELSDDTTDAKDGDDPEM
eukprot:gene5144-5794_t